MGSEFRDVWVYLSTSPLLHLTLTLAAYVAGEWLFEKSGQRPIFNPVLIAVVTLVALLAVTGTDYQTYFAGAQFVHFLLGPATVALAVPLYRQIHRIRGSVLAISVAILAGSATAVVTAVGLAWALGASRAILISLAPKSVTAPIAMGISEELGGLPSLTAVLVIVTGVLGAAFGTWVLRVVRIREAHAQGLALGVTSHGIGTARALQIGELAGAFAALAMGLNALATALILPLAGRWLWG